MASFDLQRFVDAQEGVIDAVREELHAGCKRSHWRSALQTEPRTPAPARSLAWHHGAMKQQEQQTAGTSPDLRHNEAQSRYELLVDGQVAARAEYLREGDAVRFTHTEVSPEREGQGLAARVAAFALDDVRTRGLKAIPQCSYIAGYIARHEKEYGDLVPR